MRTTRNLPDEIVEDILLLLPVRDLVRTSILSTEWRHKWKKVPCLAFDANLVRKRGKIGGKIILTEKLAKIISQILLQCSSQVESFKLDFLYTREEASPYLNEWIKILKEKGVKYLSIEMEKGQHCWINDQIFYCDKLQVLKIRLCNFLPPLSYNNFEHLKDLHLDEVHMQKSEFTELISKCPALEKLTIINMLMHPFEFVLNRLKDMFLVMDVIDLTHTAVALSLMRSSPNLEKLRIGDWWQRPVYDRDAAVKFWAKHYKENITYKHLKFVIIENYRGLYSEVDFIRYICRHLPSLKRIVLKVSWDVAKKDLIRGLPRGSKIEILRVNHTVDFLKGLSREGNYIFVHEYMAPVNLV